MKMKIFCTLFLMSLFLSAFSAEKWLPGLDKNWYTNYEEALAAAKKENKKLFVLNTGSDWCSFCIKLRKEVLEERKFKYMLKKI